MQRARGDGEDVNIQSIGNWRGAVVFVHRHRDWTKTRDHVIWGVGASASGRGNGSRCTAAATSGRALFF